ncbi:MAG TPA: succinylglutamate desuccinylase/aspartoacylase family protein, partial [Longimicrobiaceae bacterium]|nr:succinylglutamate desuccinylase/aspartoacylase family protein [Longimicrobiaceae bacterium]
AHELFSQVVRRSDFGIDLHTAAGERCNYPQVRADLEHPASADLARAFGCPLVVHGSGPDRSLRRAASAAGVPTVVYEAGSPRRFERPFIEIGKRGVLNVMRHLGMLEGEPEPPPLAVEVREAHWIRARAGGILDLKAELGQPLERGEPISLNTNPFGRERNLLEAPHAGVVLGLTRMPLVHPGDAICHLARLAPADLVRWQRWWKKGAVRYLWGRFEGW